MRRHCDRVRRLRWRWGARWRWGRPQERHFLDGRWRLEVGTAAGALDGAAAVLHALEALVAEQLAARAAAVHPLAGEFIAAHDALHHHK